MRGTAEAERALTDVGLVLTADVVEANIIAEESDVGVEGMVISGSSNMSVGMESGMVIEVDT